MKYNIILLILLLSVGTATAGQNQQCVNLFSTNSEAITKADVDHNRAIELDEVPVKILNADARAVNDFYVLGCGIPKHYITANQIQYQTPTQKVGWMFIFIAIAALIYMRSKK